MLRISIFDEPHSTTLKVEGKLAQEWVAELRGTWSVVSAKAEKRKRIIDLFGVSFVDDFGRLLLQQMHADGAKLVGSGPMISGLIEEIQGVEPDGRRGFRKKIILSMLVLLTALALCANTLSAQTATAVMELPDQSRLLPDEALFDTEIVWPGIISVRV